MSEQFVETILKYVKTSLQIGLHRKNARVRATRGRGILGSGLHGVGGILGSGLHGVGGDTRVRAAQGNTSVRATRGEC